MTTPFNPLPAQTPVTVPMDILAKLSTDAMYEMATHFAHSGAYEVAYHLISTATQNHLDQGAKLNAMAQLISRVKAFLKPQANGIDRVSEGFIPFIAHELQNTHVLNSRDTLCWFQQPKAFIEMLSTYIPKPELHALLLQSIAKDTTRVTYNDIMHWRSLTNAFDALPGSLEACIEENLGFETNPQGSIGLLMAAGKGDLPLFKSCLNVLEKNGVNPQQACAYMWEDREAMHFLPSKLTGRNALGEALRSQNIDLVQYIVTLCPQLALDKEVRRLGEICELMCRTAKNEEEKAHLMNTKGAASAIQAAIEIGHTVKTPTPEPPAKSPLQHHTL